MKVKRRSSTWRNERNSSGWCVELDCRHKRYVLSHKTAGTRRSDTTLPCPCVSVSVGLSFHNGVGQTTGGVARSGFDSEHLRVSAKPKGKSPGLEVKEGREAALELMVFPCFS